VQWSAGRRDFDFKKTHSVADGKMSTDYLLKLTIDPDSGFATKEIFYTYNKNANTLFAIFPRYPSNRKLVLRDLKLQNGAAIQFLSTKQSLVWKQIGKDVEVFLPTFDPNIIKMTYAYALKIKL
jgi:alpha-L-fucosidase